MRYPAPLLPWRVTGEEHVDVVVVGSGAAGASAALAAVGGGRRVMVVTKAELGSGSTEWAQGGLAAVLDSAHDSVEAHQRDTLVAGAGLGQREAVSALVRDAPNAVRDLQRLGARFDHDENGLLQLAREGGHSKPRIVHAGGDATGAEVQRTLDVALRRSRAEVRERCVALDVVLDESGSVAGVVVARVGACGALEQVIMLRTSAVVLATGGIGQVYAATTNPREATGDGMALALRAGAVLADMEFVQFHPTAFWNPASESGQQLLVSEAVRGEGAVLVDGAGTPVMQGVHPLGDLAPRDIVATAIAMRMRAAPAGIGDHVFLDARGIGPSVEKRFPTIVAACRKAGIDPVRQLIPVAPAAHFGCGGVRADLSGATAIAGLFAVGEVAMTGVHGANRLASNGVTEGLVAGRRVGERLAEFLPLAAEPSYRDGPGQWVSAAGRQQRAEAMSRYAGPLRDEAGLRTVAQLLSRADGRTGAGTLADLESTNLHTVAWMIAQGAAMRRESRGCHRRLDAPEQSPQWFGRIEQQLTDELHVDFVAENVAA